jgi:hypothetical protein
MSATNHDDSDVLQANATFYRAFSNGDFAVMNELWARRIPVTCLHPGSPVLVGRGQVLASWRDILRQPPPFPLRCDRPVVTRIVDDVAIISCYEGNGDRPAHLAATNVFAIDEGRWRMVHHQAGPLSMPIPKREEPTALN